MLRNATEDEILNLLNHHVRASAKCFFLPPMLLWRFCETGWRLLQMPWLAYLWRFRAGADHPDRGRVLTRSKGSHYGRGVRVPWVLKGLICRC